MRLVFCLTALSAIVAGSYGVLFECDNDADCTPSTATCVNNLCKCPPKEIINQYGTECVTLTTAIEAKCDIDEQCALFSGKVSCFKGKCQCADNHVYYKRQCIPKLLNDAACTNTDQCFDGLDYNSRVCQSGKCQCADGYYDRAGFDCRRKAALEETCSLNMDCQDEGAICSNKTCIKQDGNFQKVSQKVDSLYSEKALYVLQTLDEEKPLNEPCFPGDTCADRNARCSAITQTCFCRSGYFEKSKACIAELGSACLINSECASNICENGVCICRTGNHYNGDNRKCRATADQNGDRLNCNTDVSCRMLGLHPVCDLDGKYCRCDRGFTLLDTFLCHASCQSDDDCLAEHQICDPDHSLCVCAPEYKMVDDVCKPLIGGACSDNDECQLLVANSRCDQKKGCVCEETFVEHEHYCYKNVEIGGECTYEAQCAWIWNSTCTQDAYEKNVCKCDAGFVNVGRYCLRAATRIGDYCTHPSVCLKDTICENSKCTCRSGLRPSGDKTACVEESAGSTGGRLTVPDTNTLVGTLTAILVFVLKRY